MERYPKIEACLETAVGFQREYDPCLGDLDESLYESDTGLSLNDAGLVSLVNIKGVSPFFEGMAYPADYDASTVYGVGDKASYELVTFTSQLGGNTGNTPNQLTEPSVWVVSTAYTIGQVVFSGGVQYIALTNNTGVEPSTSIGVDWDITPWAWTAEQGSFNKWLIWQRKQAIKDAVGLLARDGLEKRFGQKLLDQVNLFDGMKVGSIGDTIPKLGRFVGMKIKVTEGTGRYAKIDEVFFQFSLAQTELPIYVFHQGSLDPVWSGLLTTPSGSTVHRASKCIANFEGIQLDTYEHANGAFYLGYFEDDLNGEAIERRYDWLSYSGCYACGSLDSALYSKWGKYFGVVPILVDNGDLNGTQLWDITKDKYPSKNYGLNFTMSVHCDISEFICQHKDEFADLIRWQFRVNMLNAMAYSTRKNGLTEQLRNKAAGQLVAPAENYGANSMLSKALKAVQNNLSDMDSPCLPCSQSVVTKFGSAWG